MLTNKFLRYWRIVVEILGVPLLSWSEQGEVPRCQQTPRECELMVKRHSRMAIADGHRNTTCKRTSIGTCSMLGACACVRKAPWCDCLTQGGRCWNVDLFRLYDVEWGNTMLCIYEGGYCLSRHAEHAVFVPTSLCDLGNSWAGTAFVCKDLRRQYTVLDLYD